MKLLIVFDSFRGYTRRFIRALAKALPEAQICDLRKAKAPSPADFDRVILGGPVYMGKLTRRMNEYLRQYGDVLTQKELGIFISCLLLNQATQQMADSFPKPVFFAAQCRAFIGGSLDSPLGRIMAKLVDDQPMVTEKMARAALQQLIDFGGKL